MLRFKLAAMGLRAFLSQKASAVYVSRYIEGVPQFAIASATRETIYDSRGDELIQRAPQPALGARHPRRASLNGWQYAKAVTCRSSKRVRRMDLRFAPPAAGVDGL
jgi:hypothetical protein